MRISELVSFIEDKVKIHGDLAISIHLNEDYEKNGVWFSGDDSEEDVEHKLTGFRIESLEG